MNKAVFLDRDGTINFDKEYLFRKEDFEWLPGAIEALKYFQECGYKLIIITNQSGIARGYYTEKDFNELSLWMSRELNKYGITIDKIYFCPHYPQGSVSEYAVECECRKPKTLLFQRAVKEFDLDLEECVAIGDRLRDCAICFQSKCLGILIGANESKQTIKAVMEGEFQNIRYAETLLDCVKILK